MGRNQVDLSKWYWPGGSSFRVVGVLVAAPRCVGSGMTDEDVGQHNESLPMTNELGDAC